MWIYRLSAASCGYTDWVQHRVIVQTWMQHYVVVQTWMQHHVVVQSVFGNEASLTDLTLMRPQMTLLVHAELPANVCLEIAYVASTSQHCETVHRPQAYRAYKRCKINSTFEIANNLSETLKLVRYILVTNSKCYLQTLRIASCWLSLPQACTVVTCLCIMPTPRDVRQAHWGHVYHVLAVLSSTVAYCAYFNSSCWLRWR